MNYSLLKLLFLEVALNMQVASAQTNITFTRQVTGSTDDVEEYTQTAGNQSIGYMYLNSSDLELMTDGTQTQSIGIRFNNITVPNGAVIRHAWIQFTTKGDKMPVPGAITIRAQDIDNAPAFTGTNFNLTSRATTIDSVSWPGSLSSTWGTSGGGTQGADQRTPELKGPVQAVVGRAGWASGNSIVFRFDGTGVRNAYSYDGNTAFAPLLILEYATGTSPVPVAASIPIAKGSIWTYLDNNVNQDSTGWKLPGFNDSTWSQGPAKLGYGNNALTTLEYGPDSANKYITYYFRRRFTIPSVAALSDSLQLGLLRNDGAVVYINGTEVVRSNMPAGVVNYQTLAATTVSGIDDTTYFVYNIPKSVLVNGDNVIAIELHQSDGASPDLGLDAELSELPEPALIRGPYLQVATTNSIHIRWRTDLAATSEVRFGTAGNALNASVRDSNYVTEHELVLTGLSPHTKYWYRIGGINDSLQGDSSNYFMTIRPAGDTALLRIGVIGDCGNNSVNQMAVRDHLAGYLGSNYMDAWILLGDNAYVNGTDAEFQAEFFNIYKDGFLKQNPLYPAPGNHDYDGNIDSKVNHSIAPYYQNFSMPSQGEAGGLPSGKTSYYSFNIGNAHFLSLDSYGQEDSISHMYDTLGAQVQWIKADLAANTNKGWVIAYWHHPPYTMGSHNSDAESDLTAIRQNFIRILERMGVDLILCGHSHDYERSRLMQGHYGLESTFDSTVNNLSSSTGLYDGSANSCPYIKDSATGYKGTVYVVAGSAGQLGGQQASYPHKALAAYSDATHGGAMTLEIAGNRLDAKWICADGVIRDRFTLMKDVNFNKTFTIHKGDTLKLTAGYNGNYNWTNTAANTKTATVTPIDTTIYTVKDNFNCVVDSFKVNVVPNLMTIQVKALLQGPLTGIAMTTTLNSKGLLPLSQPYTIAPFNYPGTEAVTAIPANITDWVLVELRDTAVPATVVAAKACLLRSDGTITDTTGGTKLYFRDVKSGNYYIAVRHRNHLGIKTAVAQALTNDTTIVYDFTTGQGKAYGANAMAGVGTVAAMWMGNADYTVDPTNRQYIVYTGTGSDADRIKHLVVDATGNAAHATSYNGATITNTYSAGDVNMDGDIRFSVAPSDVDFVISTIANAPANTTKSKSYINLVEQLP